MNQQEIEDWIEDAFKDGYSIKEIHDALREEGVEEQKIRTAVHDLRRKLENGSSQPASPPKSQPSGNSPAANQPNGRNPQNPGPGGKPAGNSRQPRNNRTGSAQAGKNTGKDVIGGVDLTGNSYKVRQNFILNRYKVWDDSGEMILKAKQKMFRLKEKIPFYDTDGNVLFRVHGQKIIDIAGDYAVIDEESGDSIAVLKKNYTIFTHHWKIKSGDSNERLLATVKSENKALSVLRVLGSHVPLIPNIFALVPHKYVIENPDSNQIGSINGKFGIRDAYEINIDDPEDIPKESLVASAIAIDALEGN